jgi:hypothetical protein
MAVAALLLQSLPREVPAQQAQEADRPQEGQASVAPADRWWSRGYGAGFYDTRWNGWFIQGYYQHGYDLLENKPPRYLSAYAIGWLAADTRSTGSGPAPSIISDNVFVAAVGLRFRPETWFWIDAQEGIGIDLVERQDQNSVRNDFRLLATAGNGIYPDLNVHDDLQFPFTLFADFYASGGYYSRYENVIAYAQGRVGGRAAEMSRGFIDAYLRLDLVFDTEHEFYNNLVEIGPGFRLTPNVDWGLFVMLEYRRGWYIDVTAESEAARSLVYDDAYNSVRFFLVFDRDF